LATAAVLASMPQSVSLYYVTLNCNKFDLYFYFKNSIHVHLKPSIVAEGLKTISAPFNPNINQFSGWWRP